MGDGENRRCSVDCVYICSGAERGKGAISTLNIVEKAKNRSFFLRISAEMLSLLFQPL